MTVMRSVTDLRFFREVRNRRVRTAVGYLSVLLILFWIIPFSVTFFSGIRTGLDVFIGNLRKHVPAETSFELKDGVLTNTLDEPIVIREEQFTIIVNTATSDVGLSDGELGVVVGQTEMVSKDAPGHTETIAYSEIPDFEITRTEVDDWIAKHIRWVILLVSVIAFLVFTIGIGIGYGVYLALHAFMLWLALKLFRRQMSYGKSFVVAAYAATMPIIVKSVFSWSSIEIGSVATYLYWMLLAFVVYDFYKEKGAEHGPKKEAAPLPSEDQKGRG